MTFDNSESLAKVVITMSRFWPFDYVAKRLRDDGSVRWSFSSNDRDTCVAEAERIAAIYKVPIVNNLPEV